MSLPPLGPDAPQPGSRACSRPGERGRPPPPTARRPQSWTEGLEFPGRQRPRLSPRAAGSGGGMWRPKLQTSAWPRKAQEARAPRHAGSPPGWARGTPAGKTWGSWGVGFGRRGDRGQLGLSSPGLFPCILLGQSRGEGVRRACTPIARTDQAEDCGPAGQRAVEISAHGGWTGRLLLDPPCWV